ncbi:MAG TPA: hypothetical protein VFY28_00115 [Candidatus Paceibacterota bacterium]|nr:hypothetical protein [Candidatus Paceibacterota bacterium]
MRHRLIGGILANRQEYQISRDHPELPVARVRSIHLWGLMLVMERGEPAPPETAQGLCMRYRGGDLECPTHICLFGGTPRYIDYGHADAPRVFGIA